MLCSRTCILEFTGLPDAFLCPTIGKGIGTLSVPFAIPEFTDVFVATGIGNGELSGPFAIPEFTDVFGATGIGLGTLSVPFAIQYSPTYLAPLAQV